MTTEDYSKLTRPDRVIEVVSDMILQSSIPNGSGCACQMAATIAAARCKDWSVIEEATRICRVLHGAPSNPPGDEDTKIYLAAWARSLAANMIRHPDHYGLPPAPPKADVLAMMGKVAAPLLRALPASPRGQAAFWKSVGERIDQARGNGSR